MFSWDNKESGIDAKENPIIYRKIQIGDDYIIASGKNLWELVEKLDEMVLMIPNGELHDVI